MACGRGEIGRRSGLKIRFPEMGVRVQFPPSAPCLQHAASLLAVSLALAGCTAQRDDIPITMSVIGTPLKLADPRLLKTDAGGEAMLAATAQGLVSFDAEGRIAPGLAERWIVTDDGMSIIFRIRRATWTDGRPVTARAVADRLRAIMAPGSAHPFRPLLGGVEQVIAMTGQVIEIRMRAPQPELLQLLAQPDMAIIREKASQGTGPYRVHSVRAGVSRMRPIRDSSLEEPDSRVERDDIRARGEPAALAVARFQARELSLVAGGTFGDLALARAAKPASEQFQVDPAYGLFGLAVTDDSKALTEASVRYALAMSIDRERIVQSFGLSSWQAQVAVLPTQLDSNSAPSALEWVYLDQAARIAKARGLIKGRIIGPIRIALPQNSGGRLLFAAIAADWRKIGVTAQSVAMTAPADLRLIDEVAPNSAALWYLQRLSCAHGLPCDSVLETSLNAARTATTSKERGDAIVEADSRLAQRQVFIPLALPLRWSLVSANLVGWRGNAFAVHPLMTLRSN